MEEQNQVSAPERKSHKKSIFIIFSVIILLVIFSVGGFFVFNNFNKDVSEKAQNIPEEEMSELTGEPTLEPSLEIKYTCDDNRNINVAIYNEGDSPGAKLTLSDGTSIILYPTESASGARYANSDESTVLWTKGDEAFIEENGKKTYTDCVENS